MNGDKLNKALIERLDVVDINDSKKVYHIIGVKRQRGTCNSIVKYNRLGEEGELKMELVKFISSFDLKD